MIPTRLFDLTGKVALLTVWSGSLAGQVNVFVTQDMLRLFAAEVARAGVSAKDMLDLARQGQGGAEADMMPPVGFANNVDPLKKFAPRLPLMVNSLSEFMEKNSFSGASLVNTDLQMYLAPEGVQPPDEEQRPFLQQALDSKQPVLMPVRRENGRLVMDMAFPIFAPLYVDSTGDRVVSLLLATYSVLPVTAVQRAKRAMAASTIHLFFNPLVKSCNALRLTKRLACQICQAGRCMMKNCRSAHVLTLACRKANARYMGLPCPCPTCPGLWNKPCP